MPERAISTDARWRPHTTRGGKPKHGYDTLDEAFAVAQRMADDDIDSGRWKASAPCAYLCNTCGSFHIGNWSDKAWRNRPQDVGEGGTCE